MRGLRVLRNGALAGRLLLCLALSARRRNLPRQASSGVGSGAGS